MFKFLYLIYGAIVVIVSTVLNLSYMGPSTGSSNSWSSHGGTSSYGGGSTGSYSGGHHK